VKTASCSFINRLLRRSPSASQISRALDLAVLDLSRLADVDTPLSVEDYAAYLRKTYLARAK